MTHRQARKKLGSRSRRRANTNGKVLGAAKGVKARAPLRRNPVPVKNVGVKVTALMKKNTR